MFKRSGAPAADVSASPHVAHAVAHHLRCVIQGVEVSFWRSFWRRRVFLTRIEEELESWLLADETKVSAYLSTRAHPFEAPKERNPDRIRTPKAKMAAHFKDHRGWRYQDSVYAIHVVRADGDPNWNKLKRSISFQRFEQRLSQAIT